MAGDETRIVKGISDITNAPRAIQLDYRDRVKVDIAGNENNPIPADEVVRCEADWTTLMNAQVFDNVTTTADSNPHNTFEWSAMWVYVYVLSAGAPTDVRVQAQFQDGLGNNWWDFEEGLWASLYWEDTDTAAGIRKVFLLPCGGVWNVRFRVTATGTGVANTFTVTIRARNFRGNFGVAHA
jgi:hypothetical protein